MEQATFLKINPADSVVVCLAEKKKGDIISIDGQDIVLLQDTPAGHKVLIRDTREGANIIKYGYAKNKDEIFIRLLFNTSKNEFIITIIDRAEEFNPFSFEGEPLKGDITHRKEGGLGILIVKKLMSEYAYDYINHKNIVTLKKKF